MRISPSGTGFLGLWALGLASFAEPPIDGPGTGCSGYVMCSGAPAHYHIFGCDNPCTAGCSDQTIVSTSAGDGQICTCQSEGWTECCTIAFVPPNQDSGYPYPVGNCGGESCPWSGDC